MNTEKLFVSFWNLCLDNFPPGEFTHRYIAAKEARMLVDNARHSGGLLCVSMEDLMAPSQAREREKHQTLCRILREQYVISLSMEDFFSKNELGSDFFFMTRPLSFAQVKDRHRLLIIRSSFRLHQDGTGHSFVLDLDPASVEFHLLEAKPTYTPQSGLAPFQFHALPSRLSA